MKRRHFLSIIVITIFAWLACINLTACECNGVNDCNTTVSAPADTPTPVPTDTPTSAPTDTPTPIPTDTPTPVPTDTPTPVPTDTPAPQIAQLHSSYSGYTRNNGYNYPMNMYVDSEDSQGNITVRIDYNTTPVSSYACTGSIGSDNRLTLTCQEASTGVSLLLSGLLYDDNHLQGNDSANGSWYLS